MITTSIDRIAPPPLNCVVISTYPLWHVVQTSGNMSSLLYEVNSIYYQHLGL